MNKITELVEKLTISIPNSDNSRVKYALLNTKETVLLYNLLLKYVRGAVYKELYFDSVDEYNDAVADVMKEIVKVIIYYGPTPCGKEFGVFFKRVVKQTLINTKKRLSKKKKTIAFSQMVSNNDNADDDPVFEIAVPPNQNSIFEKKGIDKSIRSYVFDLIREGLNRNQIKECLINMGLSQKEAHKKTIFYTNQYRRLYEET